jgi:ubiquitin carboxyl-terminal hydrolase 10
LDGLHEEMVGVLKEQLEKREQEEKKRQAANGQSDWLEVGHKNKTASLRTVSSSKQAMQISLHELISIQ